jgi:uroporphyrin-III C-methyltransferase
MRRSGKVYLVGAGPGDPLLLTIKALDLIRAADCVVYDALVSPEILEYASPFAELVDVGKRKGAASWTQSEINNLLVRKAGEYSIIVRLKGGDPFIFGRGAEEAEVLVKQGIEWEVVPGVSAGIAVPAYAGIPITHRATSSSVAFVTGHEDPLKGESHVHWDHLARGVDTIVIFMGVSRIGEIATELIRNGRSGEVPVAIVRWGTRESQQTWVTTLAEVDSLVKREAIESPAIIVIGEVVRLRSELQWFEATYLLAQASAA